MNKRQKALAILLTPFLLGFLLLAVGCVMYNKTKNTIILHV